MTEKLIDKLCVITESSNADFHKTKLAIATFVNKNKWFNGKIIILTLKSNPLTTHNIKILKQYYDVEIIEIDDTNDDLPELIKLDNLRLHIFNIKSRGNIYFSRNSIFLSDISSVLNNDTISTYEYGNTNPREISIDLDQIDSSFMFIPESYISDTKVSLSLYDNINQAINCYISENNYEVKKDIIITQSSLYPDNKYSDFVRYNKHIDILIMNSTGPSYTRIILFWLSINKKIDSIKPSKVKIIPKVKTIPQVKFYPKLNVDESKFNISVIIPAYKADEYIKECVDSIINQTTNANIEILIGIDNCQTTLTKLNGIKDQYSNMRVFYSSKSVGPYILRNSLLCFVKYDNILFFDADDIMKPNMVSTILSYYSESKPIRFKYLNFRHERGYSVNSPHHDIAHGVFFANKSIINKLGGFMPWKCGADTEFMKRCTNNNISEIRLNEYVFYRRIHSNSLTQNKSTDHKSTVRNIAKNYIRTNRDWSIPIDMVTTKMIKK